MYLQTYPNTPRWTPRSKVKAGQVYGEWDKNAALIDPLLLQVTAVDLWTAAIGLSKSGEKMTTF